MSVEFRRLLEGVGLSPDQVDAAIGYREAVLAENERQNLTRLLSPADFFRGHVLDVLALRDFRVRLGDSQRAAMDLGTGAGVPGLLSAALFRDESWVLVDSELRKTEFLRATAAHLGVDRRVSVVHSRVERVSAQIVPSTIVSRAVGKVEKLMGWLDPCSTWNSLILMKGPRWSEEWSQFGQSRWRERLRLGAESSYSVDGSVQRMIIQLLRVPRGTSKT